MHGKKNIILLASVAMSTSCASAFSAGKGPYKSSTSIDAKRLVSELPDLTTSTSEMGSRRDMLRTMTGVAFGATTAILSRTEEANASYTAYTQREEDWQKRQKTGDVQVSTAATLKAQLREIAPMNSAKSTIFCPNGPSSAVSPLMENRCNDVQAMPSVFGRTNDIAGNSIPGTASSRPNYATPGGSSSLNAGVEFPTYYKK